MNLDSVRALVYDLLRSAFRGDEYVVLLVPEGVCVLSRDGHHMLCRINAARLEATG